MNRGLPTAMLDRRKFLNVLGMMVLAGAHAPLFAASQPQRSLATITTGFAPGGSSDVVARLLADSQMAHQALELPNVRERFLGLGLEPAGTSPTEFKAYLTALHARWGDIVRTSNFTPVQ